MAQDTQIFLKQFLTNPIQIMALAPSSEKLANEMAAQLPSGLGPVVELGSGTGKITRALMANGVCEADLTLFEMSPSFCEHLRSRFPTADIRETSATEVGALPIRKARAVVSGLPLLSMPAPIQRAIVEGAFKILRPGGVFIQFTYGPNPPMRDAIARDLGLMYRRSRKVWGNLPPARVYTFAQTLH